MRDFSLPGFAEHLALIATEMVVAEHEGLERAAQIIETEAKESVGTYQPESGPFSAWAPLTDSTKEDRLRQGYPEDEPELRTGEMRDSVEHVVIGREAEVGSNSEVLEYQEFGTSKMPPRSILGGAAVRKADEAAKAIGEDVALTLAGGKVFGLTYARQLLGSGE